VTPKLPLGSNVVTAFYGGDTAYGFSSAALTQNVLAAATTTTITSSLNPSFYGQAGTFTAAVTSSLGAPPNGETVSFMKGKTVLATATLSGGSASFVTSTLPLGLNVITAHYGGDSTFLGSMSSIKQTVDGYSTSTTLISSLNPSTYGQKVTWTATVTTTGSIAPTGTLAFRWNDLGVIRTLGTATLNSSGMAMLTKYALNADSYPLTAVYNGDANTVGSSSPILNQVINQATSSATLTSSPNPSTQGQTVTFTAEITSPTFTPTGPVTFATGATVLGTAQLTDGKAKIAVSTLALGSTTVTATYYGDSNIAKSSATVTQTVH
jgi:hypothetical protein